VIDIGDGTPEETHRMRLTVFCTRISLGQPLLVSVVDPAPEESADASQEAVRKLKILNAELGNDLHSIVHSLRSSLVSLLGFSHLLRDDYSEVLGTQGCHFISRIETAGSALSAKIDEALRLSEIRLDDSDQNLVDPHKILIQIKAQQKLEFERARVSLVIAPDMPLVCCRASHLYEVFFHLLMNAAQHMGNGDDRRIEVQISEREGEHRIEVRDHGQGVPPQDHEKIFEIFRSNPASEPRRAASGVGLAIVRKIAQTYGGRAWVENAADQGARFHVTLPFID
jgi:signal transduction histidine kinase